VEELTDGQVTFEMFPSEELGGATQYLDMVKSDAIQIGYAVGGYYPGRFHLSSVTGLPQSHSTSTQGTKALWDLTNPEEDGVVYENEFKEYGLYPVSMLAHLPYQLGTKGSGTKFTDFQAIKDIPVRSTGGTQSLTLDALGVEPTELEGVELYEAMQRGTIKGYTFPPTSIGAYNLGEVTDYLTTNANITSSTLMNFMDLDKWNSLPDNVKEAMRTAGEEAMMNASETIDSQKESAFQSFRDMEGVEVYEIPDDTVTEMNERLEPVKEKWSKQQKDRNLPGDEVLTAWQEALEENA
jgi:TRAP-type C4-dicarboxylate transport system substrate-binding protein